MNRLEASCAGVKLKNPILTASGTFGFGREYAKYNDLSMLGGICSKGLTLNGSKGNKGIRIWESPSGMLNSIGLENPGVDYFVNTEFNNMKNYDTAIIVNLGGHSLEDYIEGAEKLNSIDCDMIELNISCPNVKNGGMAFGIREEDVLFITKEIKAVSKHKIMVKLSPNAHDIVKTALAAQEGGADAVSLINTIQAMAIDIVSKKAVFNNAYAGLSGPAIKPIALRMVHQVAKAVDIDVCGIGGIMSANDVIEFIMAGASAVQIGAGNFVDPCLSVKVVNDLLAYTEKENITIADIKGII